MDQNNDKLRREFGEVLSGHIHPGHDEIDTVNRLLLKSPWLKDQGTHPQIPHTNLNVAEEAWELPRLWRLVHPLQVTSDEPAFTIGAVLVLRWENSEYLMDGRRRINHWQRNHVRGPHRTLVLRDANNAA